MADPLGLDAVVLRTTRYGESDLVVQLLTASHGRVGVMAKGARSSRSRLGARLEPWSHVQLLAVPGRGELLHLRSVDAVRVNQRLRESYRLQQVAAAAGDLVTRLVGEHQAGDAAFHVTVRFLDALHDEDSALALLAAWQLKLLYATGVTPHLSSCVRCGAVERLASFSPGEGGMVCESCTAPGDVGLPEQVRRDAVVLLGRQLAETAHAADPDGPRAAQVSRRLLAPFCAHQLDIRLRDPA